MFDLQRIAESGLVGQIDFHDELGSTNDRALEVGATGEIQLPLLVLTARQSAGRGRGSNRWLTAGGALTFSMVLDAPAERLPMKNRPQAALVAGLAVVDAIAICLPKALVQLKWPNDVFLDGLKLGGILCESIPGWPDRFVIGIGINVNNALRHSELFGTATSLIDRDGIERDLTGVLLSVLDEFDRRWDELLMRGFDHAATAYRKRCLLTGKSVTLAQHDGSQITGLCRGIDEYGGLVVRTASGEKSLISGSVVEWDR